MRKALLIAAVLSSSLAQAEPCGLTKMAGFDIQGLDANRVGIPVTMDGTARLVFLDTGAPIGLLDGAVSDELQLKRNPIRRGDLFYSYSGGTAAQVVAIPSVKLGPAEVTYTDFLIANFVGPSTGPRFAGTLGTDVLKQFDVEIDFEAQKVNLFSQDHCDGKVVYWSPYFNSTDVDIDRSGTILIKVELDGHEMVAQIDTGAPTSVVFESETSKALGIDSKSPGVETLSDGNVRYKFKTLSFAGITIPGPRLFLGRDMMAEASAKQLRADKLQGYQGMDSIHNAPVLLGLDVLRRLHLYVAYKEKKLYLTAADAH